MKKSLSLLRKYQEALITKRFKYSYKFATLADDRDFIIKLRERMNFLLDDK